MTDPIQKNRRMKIHAGIIDTLKYGKTYMGIAGVLATLAQNMSGEKQEWLFIASAVFMIAGMLISSPNAGDKPEDCSACDAGSDV